MSQAVRPTTAVTNLGFVTGSLQWLAGRRWFFLLPLLTVTLASWFAIEPSLRYGLPNTQDFLHHLTALIDFDRSIDSGIWYPRRAPDVGLGHGYPAFIFYAPWPTTCQRLSTFLD